VRWRMFVGRDGMGWALLWTSANEQGGLKVGYFCVGTYIVTNRCRSATAPSEMARSSQDIDSDAGRMSTTQSFLLLCPV